MKQRILTGCAIFAVIFLAFLFREVNNLIFDGLIVCLTILCVLEMHNLLTKAGRYNNFWMVISFAIISQIGLVICIVTKLELITTLLIQVGIIISFAIITFIIGLVNTRRLKQEMAIRKVANVVNYSLIKTLNSLICFIYPTCLLSLFIVLNHISSFTTFATGNISLFLLLITLIIPVFVDIFAMFTGTMFGGKKLCPKISPNKTISGAIGGLIWGVIGAVITFVVFNSIIDFQTVFTSLNLQIWQFAILGLVGGLFCQLGDIFESYLKRKANVKDSGDSLPGHGGYLDRMDSHLFNVIVVIIFAIIIL